MSPSDATLSNDNKENNVKDLKHSLPLTVITQGHLRIPIMYGK